MGHRLGRAAFKYVSWICLLAGLLTKSSVITLPAALLLFDGIFLHRVRSKWSLREAVSRHGVYWLIAAVYLLSIILNRFLTTSLANRVRSMDEQLLTQVKALAYYGKLLVWPYGLNVEHQFLVSDSADGAVLAALAGACCPWNGSVRFLSKTHAGVAVFLSLGSIVPDPRSYYAPQCVGE